jgi:hypothetical protein
MPEVVQALALAVRSVIDHPCYSNGSYHAKRPTSGQQWSHWWTFTMPQGSEATYRQNHWLCPTTGPGDKLGQMMVCSLRVGAELAMGPGQSKECMEGTTTAPSLYG